MLGHIGINVHDLIRARTYYDHIMPLLGFEPYRVDADQFAYRDRKSTRLNSSHT